MFNILENGHNYTLPYRPAGATVCTPVEFMVAIHDESSEYLVCSDYNAPDVDEIITYLCEVHDAEYCSHYGEPGYHDPEKGIIFCDWNNIPDVLTDILEEHGYSLEWSDEWYIDYDNDKAWRTSPTSYDWQCSIRICDRYVLTPDDDISEWIYECLNDCNQALPDWITEHDLTEAGFELYNDEYYESGWYPGQNDDPATIAAKLPDDLEYVFHIPSVGQFDMKFDLYVREC